MARLAEFEEQIESRHVDLEEAEFHLWLKGGSSNNLHCPGGYFRCRREADVLAVAGPCGGVEAEREDVIEQVSGRRVVRD